MKKYFLFFTVFTFLFTGCSNDDDDPVQKKDYEYDENKVFNKSEFTGVWQLIGSLNPSSKTWEEDIYLCDHQSNKYMNISDNGIFNLYNTCEYGDEIWSPPTTWTFDGKNKIEASDGGRTDDVASAYYTDKYNLINVSNNELIANVKTSSLSGTYKFKKTPLYDCKVKDTTNLKVYWYQEQEDKSYLIGMRNDKLWIGVFDKNNKEQLFEVTDSEKFNWTKRVNEGELNDYEYHINRITVKEISSDYKRIVFLENNSLLSLWFTETNKQYNLVYDYFHDKYFIYNWYNKSFLVLTGQYAGYSCLSEKGDVIFDHGELMSFTGTGSFAQNSFAINYYDFVYVERSGWYGNGSGEVSIEFGLRSLKDKDFNKKLVKLSYPISTEYNVDISLLNRNDNIFTFKIDITEVSGEKKSHTVDVDINA